jgi:hypothetical protein
LALLSLNIEQIDRGYQNIDERLKALGAQMEAGFVIDCLGFSINSKPYLKSVIVTPPAS